MRDIKQITLNLNTARIAARDREFKTLTELREFLKEFGIKTGDWYVANGYRKLLRDNKFPKDPIYIDRVKAIYESAKDDRNDSGDEIKQAISLLKKHGYKVFAPYTEFREV